MKIGAEPLGRFVRASFEAAGMSHDDAAAVADALVTTDTWGVFSHGSKLAPGYVRRLKAGGIRADARPAIERSGPAWALVNANTSMGQIAGLFAMQTALAKAKETGVGFVTVRNSCHFGAAGYYSWIAAESGFIGVAMANDIPSVAGPGSRRPVVGSNPFSYAIPAGKYPTIMLDIAMSTVAGGKVYARHQLGEPIPEGWLIGPDGRPTTDATTFPHETSLAPMAGHKGYGIALLIESLSAISSGASLLSGVGNWIFGGPELPTDHGHAFIAIDVPTIRGIADFEADVERMVDELHAQPTAEGAPPLMMPGEMEHRRRQRALGEGITLPPDVVQKLVELSDSNGIAIEWDKA